VRPTRGACADRAREPDRWDGPLGVRWPSATGRPTARRTGRPGS
jgi:hypothetical protein